MDAERSGGDLQTCDACGATIYPEHLEKHTAERIGGRLLCPHCRKEQRQAAEGVEVAPVSLVDDDKPRVVGGRSENIHYTAAGLGSHDTQHQYRRPLSRGATATRCRTFHCKLTDASIVHLNEQINEWADADDEIEIKFATSSVGVIEGKHNDPHLIITIFY